MSFLQPWMLAALPLVALPILIHLINQWRYQTRQWGAMMFLLTANRMNRGFARIRQWLILAMRAAAIAALVFAIARPLSSGLIGLTGGGEVDTTIVLLDRSPSMQQLGAGGETKLDAARRQLATALQTLGSSHWVAIDAADGGGAMSFDSLESLMASPAMQPASASADLASMMQSALDYLQTNKPGQTEIWIGSDLRQSDWNTESGIWSVAREGFEKLPQTVRFHLLAYPQPTEKNLAIRVTEVLREARTDSAIAGNDLLISMQIARVSNSNDTAVNEKVDVPVQIEVDGVRSELAVTLIGSQTEIRRHRVPLGKDQIRGWGRVTLSSDSINGDNEYYFVFDELPPRRIVVIAEDRSTTRPLEIAALIAPDGSASSTVEVLAPDQFDSLVLDSAALLLWQTTLPDSSTAPAVKAYIDGGGQVLFLPPSGLSTNNAVSNERFLGVGWQQWVGSEVKVMVENWRGDQDLFAATSSGAGLPVGQLELSGYAKLSSDAELSTLASLTGGDPLLVRVPTSRGGVYFLTASTDPRQSSLADSGIVLFVAVQRAIERGQAALGNTFQRTAGESSESTANWRRITGNTEAISTQFGLHAGIYQSGDQLLAINRSTREDQTDLLPDEKLANLFTGLPFSRVNESAGSLSGVVREVWRLFLVSMIGALLVEAVLCLPRRTRGN